MSSHFDKFKIPFGIRGVDGELVDVHDVERGIACGCICPSCKAPLNAKKGDVKEWHFAHVSKHGYKNEVAQCDYSFFVAIRMMAKKILESCRTIALPEGFVHATQFHSPSGTRFSASVSYAKKKIFEPDSVRVECEFNKIAVDALMEKDGKCFAVFFRCPDKRSGFTLSGFNKTSYGALEIDLTHIKDFHDEKSDGSSGSYTESLRKFLLDERGNKKWLYHPREEAKRVEAEEKLKERIKNQLGTDSEIAEESTMSKLECFECKRQWVGHERRDRVCKHCGTALLVRKIS
ncbi:MAG: hypothetical protein IPN27_12030 [Cellvibrionales bacterium]|nr:hypothetical protein [Cellvibrionales bacterium]